MKEIASPALDLYRALHPPQHRAVGDYRSQRGRFTCIYCRDVVTTDSTAWATTGWDLEGVRKIRRALTQHKATCDARRDYETLAAHVIEAGLGWNEVRELARRGGVNAVAIAASVPRSCLGLVAPWLTKELAP